MTQDQFLAELTSDLNVWKVGSPQTMTLEKAKQLAEERMVYNLRMVWLGRYNKLGRERAGALNAASLAFLPEAAGYTGSKNGQCVMVEKDHYALAKLVFEKLWQQYLLSHDLSHLEPPKPAVKSMLQRLKDAIKGS
jgi:hypothetical protein